MIQDFRDCACGCGRPLVLTNSRYATKACRKVARRDEERERLRASDPLVMIDKNLLAKMVDEHAVLSEAEELQLEDSIGQAKRELFRRRGGADQEFQLAVDAGEVCE